MSSLRSPLLSIPAYYIFSIIPHVYAQTLLLSSGYKINTANPRASIATDTLEGKVPDAILGRVQRAEAAQTNCFEQQGLFAVAVLSSVFAERVAGTGLAGAMREGGEDVTGLKTFIAAFFVARSAYVVSYIQIADPSKAAIRSLCYTVGIGLSFYQIYKAAVLLA